ncbi:MAG: hypothetical protein HRT90_01750 [Candidatus Margulisbacteria bacterium]|nr:hypothetical protein [Candidatus Margulisiibacteriota bacterium]
MIYKVSAKMIEEKLGAFYIKLTDGTISNQEPKTTPAADYGELKGNSFWDYIISKSDPG